MQRGQKIVLVTAGTLGDVYPFIAVAKALIADGLNPIIATYPCHVEHVEKAGVNAHPVGPDLIEILSSHGLGLNSFVERMSADRTFFVEKVVLPQLRANLDALEVIDGASIVVSHVAAPAAGIAAEIYDVPRITVLFSPFLAPSAYDPPVIPPIPFISVPQSLVSISWNRALIALFQLVLKRISNPVTKLRRELGLADKGIDNFSVFGPKSDAYKVLGLYSPLLNTTHRDHPDGFEVVGSTSYNGPISEPLDSQLQDFLKDGDAPIIFTMGSLSTGGKKFHETCIGAARCTGRRALLLVANEEQIELADLAASDVFVSGHVPHSIVFPQACLIAHHGGIGTTTQALKAGLPQLVIPHCNDQFDNAARLERIGVARNLSVNRFQTAQAATAIEELLTNPEITTQSSKAASIICSEDGASEVAKQITAALTNFER